MTPEQLEDLKNFLAQLLDPVVRLAQWQLAWMEQERAKATEQEPARNDPLSSPPPAA